MSKLDVALADAYAAYDNKSYLSLVDAGLLPEGLPQKAPDVGVTITDGGRRATIRYGFDLTLVASDDDELEDVEELIRGILTDASSKGISTSGIPGSALDILDFTFKTVRRVQDIWETDHRIVQLAVRDLPVTIVDRNGRAVTLRTRVMIDASWMANDPTEWGSYAWMELEMHRITAVIEHKASPPDDLDDLRKQDGIVPWAPAHDDDLVGAFASDLHKCDVTFGRDQVLVTVDVSCNAISDDEVVALVIRSMTIEFELLGEEEEDF